LRDRYETFKAKTAQNRWSKIYPELQMEWKVAQFGAKKNAFSIFLMENATQLFHFLKIQNKDTTFSDTSKKKSYFF
jgi:L-rhamnose mutarotase